MKIQDHFAEITQDWNTILNSIFGNFIPANYKWTDTNEIINVLNKIGADASTNYIFFPGGGGMTLTSANLSHEDGCIEFVADDTFLVKLKSLTFVSIGADNSCSYFRLETEKLNSTGVNEKLKISPYLENLIELLPLNYMIDKFSDYGEDDYDHLPKTARPLVRILKGDLVIFSKSSLYNNISNTDNGRHSKMKAAKFKKYVVALYNEYQDGFQKSVASTPDLVI